MSDRAATHLKLFIQGLSVVTPAQFPVLLSEVGAALCAQGETAGERLASLDGTDPLSPAPLTAGVAEVAKLMLRDATCIWETVGQMVTEHRKRAPEEVGGR